MTEVLHELDRRRMELDSLKTEIEVSRRSYEGIVDRVAEGERARSRVEVQIRDLVDERRQLAEQMANVQLRIEQEEKDHKV